MASMSRGEPRSVPDPDGEGYDEMLRRWHLSNSMAAGEGGLLAGADEDQQLLGGAGDDRIGRVPATRPRVWVTVDTVLPAKPSPQKVRAKSTPANPPRHRKSYAGHPSQAQLRAEPWRYGQEFLADIQDAPYVGHTGAIDGMAPFYAPLRNGIADVQDGNWVGVAGNTALLAGDVFAVGLGTKLRGLNAATQGLEWYGKKGVRAVLGEKGWLKPKQIGHHAETLQSNTTAPLSQRNDVFGIARMPMPPRKGRAVHLGLHRGWASTLDRALHGVPIWQKVTRPLAAAHAVDGQLAAGREARDRRAVQEERIRRSGRPTS